MIVVPSLRLAVPALGLLIAVLRPRLRDGLPRPRLAGLFYELPMDFSASPAGNPSRSRRLTAILGLLRRLGGLGGGVAVLDRHPHVSPDTIR